MVLVMLALVAKGWRDSCSFWQTHSKMWVLKYRNLQVSGEWEDRAAIHRTVYSPSVQKNGAARLLSGCDESTSWVLKLHLERASLHWLHELVAVTWISVSSLDNSKSFVHARDRWSNICKCICRETSQETLYRGTGGGGWVKHLAVSTYYVYNVPGTYPLSPWCF